MLSRMWVASCERSCQNVLLLLRAMTVVMPRESGEVKLMECIFQEGRVIVVLRVWDLGGGQVEVVLGW